MTWLLAVGAVLSGVAGVAATAVLVGRARVTVLAVVLGLTVLALASVVVLVVASGRGLGPFGLTRLLYLQAAVAIPILGAGLLALAAWRSTSRPALVGAALLLVPAPIGFWGTHVAPFRLQVDRHQVPVDDDRAGAGSVRIAVLADLQTTQVGEHERRAVQAVLDAEPDLILLPGDLFQADAAALREHGPGVRELLGLLRAPGGVYLIEGDVDSPDRLAALVPPNVTVLDDRVVDVDVRDRRVRIGGTRLDMASPSADEVRRELIDADGQITVLVSHRPGTVLELAPKAGIDLVVAGHTHGGQISVPFFGPPVTLSRVPREVGAGGLHTVAGNPIYVSTGVGMERGQAPQVRLGVPPSIGILDLG